MGVEGWKHEWLHDSLLFGRTGRVCDGKLRKRQAGFSVYVGGGNGTDIAITTVGGDLEAGALNLLSPGGYLVENPDGADPFGTRIDAVFPNQVSYAKLGGKVVFAEGTTVVRIGTCSIRRNPYRRL